MNSVPFTRKTMKKMTMKNKFTIYGRLPSLNEYVLANRGNKYAGASMKKHTEKLICKAIRESGIKHHSEPVTLSIDWYEPNNRRDLDNIQFGTKFIQDAMVKAGILTDDSRKYVVGLEHHVFTDKENPRIEVEIRKEKENDHIE